MVPEGWKGTNLGEVVEVRLGATPPRKADSYWASQLDEGYPWVSISDLPDGKWIDKTTERITDEGVKNSSVKLVPPGRTLVSFKLSLGKAARAAIPLYTNEAIAALVPIDGKVDDDFLYYTIPRSIERATSAAQAVKGRTLNKGKLQGLFLALPPLPEQQKIAVILSSVDDAIVATRKVIEQTKRVKTGLLQTLMTRGIGHTRLKETEIGKLPEEWVVRKLSEVASVERGKFTARPRNDPKYYGGETPFVQTGDVTDSDVVLSSHTQTLNEEGVAVSRVFPAGTILITIAANIGEVAQAAYPMAFPDSVVGIQPGDRVDGRWLLYMLEIRKKHLNNVATQNAQKNINLRILRPLRIPVPQLDEQRRIASRLDALSQAIWDSDELLGSLHRLKDGLIQDLLTGRVRVQPD